ncbi:hypothetical protein EV361DRAFT_944941 [Lentinula raphanica]|nr:hypothetical protein EV361DRAFT_944941 [Lentinula raphanica]
MQLFMPFPNELLHEIIEYVAYLPVPPDNLDIRRSRESLFKQASPDLLALSLANRWLRQACLPFLFAHVKIRNTYQDNIVERLENCLALLSKFTKTLLLRIRDLDSNTSQLVDRIATRILPSLKQLSYVDMDCSLKTRPTTVLLLAILEHPTITMVLIHELPPESLHGSDLSKVILDQEMTFIDDESYPPNALRTCLDNNMRLTCLELYTIKDLDKGFGLRKYSGLEELRIWIDSSPLVTSWLPVLSSTHPTFNELWLIDDYQLCFPTQTPTSISSFNDESQRQGLKASCTVKRIGLRRDTGHLSQEWFVMGLTLRISTSLVETLMLVASSFPKLEILALDLDTDKGMYDVDDLASVFAHFSSLRIVKLHNVLERLNFGSKNEIPPVQQDDSTDVLYESIALAENGMFHLASLLAKRVRTLDFFFIHEKGYDSEYGEWWDLIEWLYVLNSNRDISERRLGVELETFDAI